MVSNEQYHYFTLAIHESGCESFWKHFLYHKIYESEHQYETVSQLEEAVTHIWENFCPSKIQKFIGSMPERIYDML